MQNVDNVRFLYSRFLEYSSVMLYNFLVVLLTTLCFVNSWESGLLGVQVSKSPSLSHFCQLEHASREIFLQYLVKGNVKAILEVQI